MMLSRRTFLTSMGALPMVAAGGAEASAASQVKPRHVLCFLGGEGGNAALSEAVSGAIADFARGFSIDETYSLAKADPHMKRSFGVCWDRVEPNAWTERDEEAVLGHKSVLYVLSPPMTAETSVTASTAALMMIHSVIKAGAIAVKGESAGIAHGLARWQQLIAQAGAALQSDDDLALRRVCRLAFAKRPLSSAKYFESVGFHLVGLPEVYVAKSYGSDREAVAVMDEVADDIAKRRLDAVLGERKATLTHKSSYEWDDFKFNPYGIVLIDWP
jgi:hypothetical protein